MVFVGDCVLTIHSQHEPPGHGFESTFGDAMGLHLVGVYPWLQVFILDTLVNYQVQDSKDAEKIVERVLPRLQHVNSAVVLSAAKVGGRLSLRMYGLCKQPCGRNCRLDLTLGLFVCTPLLTAALATPCGLCVSLALHAGCIALQEGGS